MKENKSMVLVDPVWLFESTLGAIIRIEKYREVQKEKVRAELIKENKKRLFGLLPDRSDEDAFKFGCSDIWDDRWFYAAHAFETFQGECEALNKAAENAINRGHDSIVKEIRIPVETFDAILNWNERE